MSKPEHTPGPWRVEKHDAARGFSIQALPKCNPNGSWHSFIHGLSEEDAQLIAAAPDLLEALDEVVDSGQLVCCDGEDCVVHGPLISQVKDALAKARGEQS